MAYVDDLEALMRRNDEQVRQGVVRVIYAVLEGRDSQKAALATARAVSEIQLQADLLGRQASMRSLGWRMRGGGEAPKAVAAQVSSPSGTPSLIPRVPFAEAAQSIAKRDPVLARGYREAAEAYNKRYQFALAKSTSEVVTRKVQEALIVSAEQGVPRAKAVRAIKSMLSKGTDPVSRAYAETVFRTNIASSYAAGRWRVINDPEVKPIVGGLEFVSVHDANTRPNHEALDGIVRKIDDPIWTRIAPPRGYNCRCTTMLVPADRYKGPVGDIPAGWQPDPGFEAARPDFRYYGGGV